jgi:hypothetical protein
VITIEREVFSRDTAAEILPLAQRSWEESTVFKKESCAYFGDRDITLDPDIDRYVALSEQGSVVLMALRDSGVLQGYIIGLVYRSLHHKPITGGIGDLTHIEPSYRSYTAVMIEKFEREMKALDVDVIGWPTHIDGPVYEVLKARGYVGDDIVMEKRI